MSILIVRQKIEDITASPHAARAKSDTWIIGIPEVILLKELA